MSTKEQFLKRFENLENLPTLPETAKKLMAVVDDPNASASDIAQIVQYDPAISAALLKLVNSAHYTAGSKQIGNIQHAITRLGLEEVKRVSLAFGAMKLFTHTSGLIDLKEFWRHSISVALSSKSLANYLKFEKSFEDDCYTAGLFHDIGVFILDQFFQKEYQRVRVLKTEKKMSMHGTESFSLGIDHGEIGAMLLNKWNFPQQIINAISFHHKPGQCGEDGQKICNIVHLADFSASSQGEFEPGEEMPKGFSLSAWHDLGLTSENIPHIIEATKQKAEEAAVFTKLGLA